MGIVPLFYTYHEGRLIFASEIKAILPILQTAPSLSVSALDQLMTFWSPVSPNTLFENIYELPPGMLMTQEGQRQRKQRYWDWQFPSNKEDYRTESESQLMGDRKSVV